ncbi:MAG: hypothetical protein NC120_08140 [Ruminococcus sp.]|nr:hypothetical protein [Ruminococcus sp.]
MSLYRYRMVYPESIFRGIVISKNVAPPEDKWAEGALCRDENGNLLILDRKFGDGAYGARSFYFDTLGLGSGFRDGNEKEIFEGDIISVSSFGFMHPMGDDPDSGTDESDESEPSSDEEDKQEEKRRIYADVPQFAAVAFTVQGVVFMNGGSFYIQYFDESIGMLNSMPLFPFFGFDMLPAPNNAVKIVGNMYEDEELYSNTLRLAPCDPNLYGGETEN